MVQRDSDTILHQSEVEAVVSAALLGGADVQNEAIDDLVPITGGQSPTEAEHNLVVSALNDVLATSIETNKR